MAIKAEIDVRELVELDKRVDFAEGEGLRQRWLFGKELLARREGKQLPNGLLDKLVAETKKSREELKKRVQFASKYPTEAEVGNAITHFKSWYRIVNEALPDSTANQIVSSESNEWYTPAKYIESARFVMGGIDLDPASCKSANRTVKAEEFFDAEADGLSREWHGRVWLNPPYGDAGPIFVTKLLDEIEANRIESAILLVNSHCTDAGWFQPLWDHMICFTDHRVNFWRERGNESGSTHGSAFVYFGPSPDKFAQEFNQYGAIVRKYSLGEYPQS